MKRSKIFSLFVLFVMFGLALGLAHPVFAQSAQPTSTQPVAQQQSSDPQSLAIYTTYPSQVIGFGEVVTMTLQVQAGTPQTVKLDVTDLPQGWNASFRGGSKIVDAVYVDGVNNSTVDLRLEPPADLKAGKYDMTVVASGKTGEAEMPISLTVKEKLPPSLALTVDGLPAQQGSPSSTFSYNLNLNNQGGEDLTVALTADQPNNLKVSFESAGEAVNEVQIAAGENQSLVVKAEPLINLDAGDYPFTIYAKAGDVQTQLQLNAQVVGEGSLSVTAPDGLLSGNVYAGQETPLKIVLANNGTAPVSGIQLTSSEPTGWSVTFDPAQIAEIPAGQQVEVTARVKPSDKAVAGDYMLTVSARPLDSKTQSADFRLTVLTSTLWGMVGIGLIAVAVLAVGVAVVRFGRR
ncbi:MAG: hypothetical protein GYA17_17835 [Chloroflexi bacterium]|nr:NEW3 domain-containing protein [Anaerolineaceae bacterium]NMB90224.1 hypothetical protein [Chloroflexota bacterium]